jgi:hypothetical protein
LVELYNWESIKCPLRHQMKMKKERCDGMKANNTVKEFW